VNCLYEATINILLPSCFFAYVSHCGAVVVNKFCTICVTIWVNCRVDMLLVDNLGFSDTTQEAHVLGYMS